MQLETKRLCLRLPASSDANELLSIYGDPATNLVNPAGPYPDIQCAGKALERWIDHWDNYGVGNWVISPIVQPEIIIGFGGLTFSRYADISINNLGHRFATEAWGKSFTTELAEYAWNMHLVY
ncbi:GNAT family N-acetyltransferase [Pantoea rwandensis]|uniref:GNAT family N-acetyltransferase n=1 Tax=Pantoea rwandensis TaxID=1076550 RepID=UPI001301DCDD|nr:GNAT family N-acetyltransferase [Pantoea rwandensis]